MYLWEHREQVNMAENIKGYIYFCVRTRCANHIKEAGGAPQGQKRDHQRRLLEAAIQPELPEQRRAFQKTLPVGKSSNCSAGNSPKVPELTRAVYQASRQEGLTYQQIAERYNISTRQVASEMQRAYAQLRVPLKDYLPVIGLLFAMLSK